MEPLLPFFRWMMEGRVRRFHAALRDPRTIQIARLRDILQANQNSAFGRAHAFASIRSLEDYRRAVPIRPPEAFFSDLERMKRGEPGILVSQPVERFAITSGTTAVPKLCPVTRRFIHEYHAQHLLWMRFLVDDRPPTLLRGFLSVISPAESYRTEGGIPVGASSGIQFLNQSIPIRRRHVVPYEVCQVKDYASRYHALLVFALGREVRVVTSVNPSTLVLLARILQERAEALLEDLAAGSLRHAPHLTEQERSALERLLRPAPQRARFLREILRADGTLLPRTVWPHLVAINCWQGGSAPFYLAQLDELWGKVPRRCLGLRASEGTFTIPLRDHTPSGVLAVGGHVMEFVEGEDTPTPQTPTLLPHELELGKRYRLIITTSGGFYRYDLGDIVEVTGFYFATPEVAFLHKAGHVLSITGEKVTEDQVVGVMAELEASHLPPEGAEDRAWLAGFTVTLELDQTPRYALLVEARPESFRMGIESAAAEAFWHRLLHDFDRALCKANEEYECKRMSGRLAPPLLFLLAPGSYRAYREALVASGRPDSQIKPPHLLRPAGVGRLPLPGSSFFEKISILRRFEG